MRFCFFASLGLLVLGACGVEPAPQTIPLQSRVALSPPIHIDQKWKSMAGPISNSQFVLGPGPPELLWITAYRTEVVTAEGEESASGEFMCHTNMVYDGAAHAAAFGTPGRASRDRLFSTAQGQFEVELPPGFGIPVLSNEPLGVNTQVLNHNIENPDLDVRFRVEIDYVRDADVEGMKPLFPTFGYVMALVDGDHGVFGVASPDHVQDEASCLPGGVAPQAAGQRHGVIQDDQGQSFTGHWVVPPGREERRTLVTHLLSVPFDTTIHYIAAHVHPFAESLELRDLTTGETVFKSLARGRDAGIGLAHVDHFASPEGIPIYADHEYEMISIYDNTSGEDQDAMATLFLYLYDKEAELGIETLRRQIRTGA